MHSFAIRFDSRKPFRFAGCEPEANTPRILRTWVVPAFITVSGLNQAQQRRFKSKCRQRNLGRPYDTGFKELQSQQFGKGIQRACMGMHIQYRKICPAEWHPPCGFARALTVHRIQYVRTAPCSIPHVRISFCVSCERILFPFIPCHLAIHSGERPDQRLI